MKKIYSTLIVCLMLAAPNAFSGATYYLDVTVYGEPANSNEADETSYSINAQVMEYNGWTGQPTIHLAIIDSAYCIPVSNCNTDFGQVNIFTDPDGDCLNDANTYHSNPNRARAENYFMYRSNEPSSVQAMLHLIDSVAPGHFILAYSWFPITYSAMDPAFRATFQALGASLLPQLGDGLPFIFFCKKGDVGTVVESVGSSQNSQITLQTTYQCSPTSVAEIESPVINVFPNPVSETLTVQFQNQNQQPILINIYDGLGKLVLQRESREENETFDLQGLVSGIYYVTVMGNEYSVTKKLCRVTD